MVDTINTIKFSQFMSGGDLSNDKFTVGLDSTQTVNTIFNNPWTFLASGTTGDRPTPVPAIYFRLRFNTTLEVYEYYDPTTVSWIELSGSGMGTVNPGLANDLAFYGATGTAISPIARAANSVLVTNGSDVPSLSTTLPTGLSIPGATITSSTAALTAGSVVAAPVAGTDIANKAYVDTQVGGDVTSITGTTNQVIASSPTGAVTLSLPQDIALGSTPTFAGLTLSSPLTVPNGGTGVASTTAYAVICGGTTSTGALQSVASVGTAGQLLVSAGAGALPAFQTVITDWVAYTPTLTGFGTPSSVQIYSRRVGDTLEIRGRFTSGTSTAVEARMTLGYAGSNANVTSSNTKISSIQYAGYATLSSVTTTQNNTLIEANTGYITFGIQNASQAGLTKANGNSILGTGVSYSFIASIPIDSWP